MIVFDKLWGVMKEKGVSTYLLREKCGIDSKTVRRLRANDNMETKTLNKLCTVLDCRLEDIAEYVPDENGGGESKGGDFPSWHTTFGESLVCLYLLSRLARERGGAVWRRHFPAPGNQAVGWSAAIIPPPDFERDKRYIKPRPSSFVPP